METIHPLQPNPKEKTDSAPQPFINDKGRVATYVKKNNRREKTNNTKWKKGRRKGEARRKRRQGKGGVQEDWPRHK